MVKNKFRKPQHFLPFSAGRRSCIGSKMVQLVATSMTATLLKKYTLSCDIEEVPLGMLALPPQPTMFQLKHRSGTADVVSSTDSSSILSSSPSHPALSSLVVESSHVSSPTFYLPSSDQTKIESLQDAFVKQRHLSGQQDRTVSTGLARTTSISSFDQYAARIRHSSGR